MEFKGPANCKIKDEKGHIKFVNIDQLKRVENRYTQFPKYVDKDTKSYSDVFDNEINDESNQRWCDISENNIIQSRARSEVDGGT